MLNRVKIHESDISWSSFRCASEEERNKRIAMVEDVLNYIIFAKDSTEIETVVQKYILKSSAKFRVRTFITFLSFNNRKGSIFRYSLKEDGKVITIILNSKNKKEIGSEEGFYGWEPHRLSSYDIKNSLYRVLYPPTKYKLEK